MGTPSRGLSGTWEGDDGVDVAYGNVEGHEISTPFRERATFNPFGPVVNGAQELYGLDYRTAAWRAGEENPFHTKSATWLWDAAAGLVMRCFMVPRGSTVLAGGRCAADAREFTLRSAPADLGVGAQRVRPLRQNATARSETRAASSLRSRR